MSPSVEYPLGQITARLAAIEKRLDDGSVNFTGHGNRLAKLEIIEARRAGVIAAITALASILGGLITTYFTKKL